ncbi:Nicotinamide/nicotinic acid mononucleotide adenylyltransferase 1 [Ceratocystis lukuohia]|uniref:Nicotinamide/nicotinic acid mononucleotide adenylyltransferase 1 n=1 Tax=Ceratocystis lukuohia TaxID=2019550 RepID=A0ABR4MT21_9PEZI
MASNAAAHHAAYATLPPPQIPASQMTLETYQFPAHRLRTRLTEPNKTPLVLVACGSFSPITFLHLRMFPMAADYARHANTEFEVIGGFLSPVSDAYKKGGLAPSHHRIVGQIAPACHINQYLYVLYNDAIRQFDTCTLLCIPCTCIHTQLPPSTPKLITSKSNPFSVSAVSLRLQSMCEAAVPDEECGVTVDPWEALQPEGNFVRPTLPNGVLSADGKSYVKPRIALLAGADLVQTMSTPGVWAPEDLDHILGRFGAFIVERSGTDIEQAIDSLQKWRKNIHVIQQVFQNNMSSTQIRLHIKRDMSVQYRKS